MNMNNKPKVQRLKKLDIQHIIYFIEYNFPYTNFKFENGKIELNDIYDKKNYYTEFELEQPYNQLGDELFDIQKRDYQYKLLSHNSFICSK